MSGTTKFTAEVTQAIVLSHWARIKAALAAPILLDNQLEYNKYLKLESHKAFQIAQNGDVTSLKMPALIMSISFQLNNKSEEEIGKFQQEDFSSDVLRLASNPWSIFATDKADLPTNVDISNTKTQWRQIYHKCAADAADAAKSTTSESIGDLLFQPPCTHCKKSLTTCIVVYQGRHIAGCERCTKDDCSALKVRQMYAHLFAVLLVVPTGGYHCLVEMGNFPINPVQQDSPFTLTLNACVEDIMQGLAEHGFTFAEADDMFVFIHQYINNMLSTDLPLLEPTQQVMIAHHGYVQSPGIVAVSLEYLAQGSAQVALSTEGPPYKLMQGVLSSTGGAPLTMGVPPTTLGL
ncbi:hypothetical protein HYDPIDRAFT_34985 [Hydnomerulius pinastri MD-312]|uniref:Uncharacterized protein n=1 Tax=Hydnomerulius pinastri MD-312 TaxID=994086 RepID=A0A0C2PR80_9AGAM|nr:hypothetical protein HYDPIDRAFT_34985 [Hydnomerulius pinastri MD-312]